MPTLTFAEVCLAMRILNDWRRSYVDDNIGNLDCDGVIHDLQVAAKLGDSLWKMYDKMRKA